MKKKQEQDDIDALLKEIQDSKKPKQKHPKGESQPQQPSTENADKKKKKEKPNQTEVPKEVAAP